MQLQKAGILRENQQKNCARRGQCDTTRALIASVVIVDGFFFGAFAKLPNRLLVSSSVFLCLSVRPFLHIEKIDSLWTDFHKT